MHILKSQISKYSKINPITIRQVSKFVKSNKEQIVFRQTM